MYAGLVDILEPAMLDGARVEVKTKDGDIFTGISDGIYEDDDLGWFFEEVEGVDYSIITLEEIASVKRLDTNEVYAMPV